MRRLLILLCFISIAGASNSQVLISLLLGDKLNSDGLEFGLDGGFGWNDLVGAEGNFNRNFNLGFYFDFKFPNRSWMVHTGVIVKSTMGGKDLNVYSLGDPELDSVFVNGSIERRLSYFNVPVMIKHIFPQRIYFEGGFMLGLRHKAIDVFKQSTYDKDDTQFTNNIKDHIKQFDAGLIGGVGYKLKKSIGMYISVRYYYGLMDITVGDKFTEQNNSTIYACIGVPIGAGKAAKTNAEKAE